MFLKIIILICCVIFFHLQGLECNIPYKEYLFRKRALKLTELPKKQDLNEYLTSLERVVDSLITLKDEIEKNSYIGLFLMQVNLLRTVTSTKLPRKITRRIKGILAKSDYVMDYFMWIDKEFISVDDPSDVFSSTGIRHQWAKRMKNYTISPPIEILNIPTKDGDNLEVYTNFKDYILTGRFTGHNSDDSLEAIGLNPRYNLERTVPKCIYDELTLNYVIFEANYGYTLTHRLLTLLVAWFSRGCVITSFKYDNEIARDLCTTGFYEAEYLAHNMEKHGALHGVILDLLAEHIALCTLNGHSLFLRRSWLSRILTFQNPNGCFSAMIVYKPLNETEFSLQEHNWRNNPKLSTEMTCNLHATATSMGAIASAVRYIAQIYY